MLSGTAPKTEAVTPASSLIFTTAYSHKHTLAALLIYASPLIRADTVKTTGLGLINTETISRT